MSGDGEQVFRNVCPRNCYGTCGMLSYVKNGRLVKVEGDPKHGYTKGRLCLKGYAYPEYVYHPQRLRYPLRQYPRGSGQWQRISWAEALTAISEKMLELHSRYGSNLTLSYNKFSGNLGFLHQAVEGMFNSFGPHTRAVGDACLAAGSDALSYDCGEVTGPDPESMADAGLIVIWGVNPAWTAVHQLHFIEKARERGAPVVVIDPLFTPTAAKADLYLQIQPGTDGLLALAVLKLLHAGGELEQRAIRDYISGWESFEAYLNAKINPEAAAEQIGIDLEGIRELADLYARHHPAANWVGFGLQRHANGGQTVRAINALTALTGNLGVEGGGLFYCYFADQSFPRSISNVANPAANRLINLNQFPQEALRLQDPPLKFLWVAGRNPLSQDPEVKNWEKLIARLEMVVTVDLFLNQTAERSDIVLPAASHFEELDLNTSFWHRWVGINEPALPPFYEAKSDLQIARELTARLNELAPGFSSFPSHLSPSDWLEREFTPEILSMLGIASWQDLKKAPCKLPVNLNPWQNRVFKTEDQKFSLYTKEGKANNFPALPRYKGLASPGEYPLRLLTPQHLNRIHSQYSTLMSLNPDEEWNVIEIHPQTASRRKIADGDWVEVYNATGSGLLRARLNSTLPVNVVMAYQGGEQPINSLIPPLSTDMGVESSGNTGPAFYDVLVDIKKSRGGAHA